MTNSSTSRRRRWPRYTEEARAEAETLAEDAATRAAEVKTLIERARVEWKRHNTLVVELMLADAMILLAEVQASNERIHRLLIEAKQGKEAESK